MLEGYNSYLPKTNDWVLNMFPQYLGKGMLKGHYFGSLALPVWLVLDMYFQCGRVYLWDVQALSGDFQHTCGKTHAQVLLTKRWCAMSIFIFLKFYSFIKGIKRIHSIFKKPKNNVFIKIFITCNRKMYSE